MYIFSPPEPRVLLPYSSPGPNTQTLEPLALAAPPVMITYSGILSSSFANAPGEAEPLTNLSCRWANPSPLHTKADKHHAQWQQKREHLAQYPTAVLIRTPGKPKTAGSGKPAALSKQKSKKDSNYSFENWCDSSDPKTYKLPPPPEAAPTQVALPLTTNNDAKLLSPIALPKISNDMNVDLPPIDNSKNPQQG